MISGKEKIKEWFQANGRPNFKIKKTANTDAIVYSQSDNPTMPEGLQELEAAFSRLSQGQYFMECWKGGDKKNWAKTIIIIDGTADENPQGNVNGICGEQDIESLVKKGIEDYKRNEEYEDLKKEVAELRDEKDSLTNRLLKRLDEHAPIIGQLITGYMQSIPGIGDINKKKTVTQINNNEMANEDNNSIDQETLKRASTALENWYAADPEAIEMMEQIAKMAVSNPTMYKQAKNLLKNM